MPVSASKKRRWTIALLVTVIAVAMASILKTSIDRELLPPQTAFALGAALSPSSAQRQFYRLRGTQEALSAEIDQVGQRARRGESDHSESSARQEWSRHMREQLTQLVGDYDQFLAKHPKHLAARLACADLLGRLGDEPGAMRQREAALTLAPNNASLHHEMANQYLHTGKVDTAFGHFDRAVNLAPREPMYHYNLASALFLYRRDAMRIYQVNEQQVFDRALLLFNQAVDLDPANLELAADVARTYYGVKPLRVEGAIAAWNRLYRAAAPGVQRQEAALNLARVNLEAGRLQETHEFLAQVTHEFHRTNKERLAKRLADKESPLKGVTILPASTESN